MLSALAPRIVRIARGRLARNALSLYAVQGLNFLLPLALLPYLLRVLSPEAYGSIVFAQAFMGYFIMLTDFGFNLTAARDISVAREDPQKVARIYWTTQAAKCALLLLAAVIVFVAVGAVPRLREDWTVFAACSLLLLGSSFFPTWYFQGLERLRDTAIIQVLAKCLVTTAIFVFVRTPRDTVLAAVFMSSPQLIGLLAALALGYPAKPATFYRPSLAEIRAALRGSFDMFLSTVSSSLYLYTNTFVLGLMAGARPVAFYSVGNRLVSAMLSLTSPVTQAVYPRASLLFASDRPRAWQLVRRVSWLLLPAIGAVALLTAIFAPLIVRILAGPSYGAASLVTRIMAPIPVLVTAASLLAQTIMVNLGLARYLWRIYLMVGLMNLAILPVLVHLFVADGAAAALTIAEALGPILMICALRRHENPWTSALPSGPA